MNLQAPVSTIMSMDLKSAHPDDAIILLRDYFENFRIHHVPVVVDLKVVGIVSKSDFLYLLRGFTVSEMDRFREEAKLRAFKVREIMAKKVETLTVNEPIKKAVALLAENRFQAIPILNEKGELVGIVTTHDIINLVNEWGGNF